MRDSVTKRWPSPTVTYLVNGHVIYAATGQKTPYLPDFVAADELLGAPKYGYAYYGDSGIDLYAQELTSLAWVTVDRPSLSVEQTFLSFDSMLVQILRNAVEGLSGF